MFPSYHGMVHIHTLPSPITLLPPSDRFSTLRGLSASGENNLAFKCMRKRLVFETLHLDVEGGVSERRTTPSANTIAMQEGTAHGHDHATMQDPKGSSLAAVQVQLEQTQLGTSGSGSAATTEQASGGVKKAKVKKKVAFISERPDLYDF